MTLSKRIKEQRAIARDTVLNVNKMAFSDGWELRRLAADGHTPVQLAAGEGVPSLTELKKHLTKIASEDTASNIWIEGRYEGFESPYAYRTRDYTSFDGMIEYWEVDIPAEMVAQ